MTTTTKTQPTIEQLSSEALRRWPLDPSTQVYWIKRELAAIEQLKEFSLPKFTPPVIVALFGKLI